jgi:hypothetical protein
MYMLTWNANLSIFQKLTTIYTMGIYHRAWMWGITQRLSEYKRKEFSNPRARKVTVIEGEYKHDYQYKLSTNCYRILKVTKKFWVYILQREDQAVMHPPLFQAKFFSTFQANHTEEDVPGLRLKHLQRQSQSSFG